MTRFAFLIGVILVSIAGKTQVHENQQWISFNAGAMIAEDLKLEVEEAFRFGEMAYMSTTYTELGLSYKFSKQFKAAVGYRLAYRGSWSDYANKDDRFNLDLVFSEKFGDVKLSWKTRYQQRYRDWHTSAEGWRPQIIWRNKITASYKVNKDLQFSGAYEMFHRLNDPGQSMYLQQNRINISTEYEFSKKLELGLFYIYQWERAVRNPEFNHIVGLSLAYVINP